MKIDLSSRIHRTLNRTDSVLPGRSLVKQITYIVDSTISTLFRSMDLDENVLNRLCLIPIGGYGRMELAPHSDIDLLYLHDDLDESTLGRIISKINNALTDAGMEVGHSCRTIEESKNYIDNMHSFHAVLDSRYLVGSKSLYNLYEKEFLMKIPLDLIEVFYSIKMDILDKHVFHSHHPLYLTEPNIKNDPLGLRDIQYMYWIEKTSNHISDNRINGIVDFFTKGDTMDLILAYDFLLRTRVALHKLTKKKTDRLELSLQADVAEELNFGPKGLSSLESFMSTFYKYQKDIKHSIGLFLDSRNFMPKRSEFEEIEFLGIPLARTESYLYPSSRSKLFTQPDSLYREVMTVFLAAQNYRLEISPTLMEELKFASHFLDDDFKNNGDAIHLFLQMLKENHSIGKYLTYMHHCNILGKFIPEFGACTNFPLFSYHHEYPVDEHSLLILRELDILVRGEFPDKEVQSVYYDCSNIHILYLALLVHDAGKVKEGDHCQYGAELTHAISERWNLSEEEKDLFQFLVAHHIDMSEISNKRDIFDPNLIQDFANIVYNVERLNLLYVLTIIDTKSVGPHILTNWKKDILYKLYESTKIYLLSNASNKEMRANKIQQLKNYLTTKENLPDDISQGIVDFAQSMYPLTYINSITQRRIFNHFKEFQLLIQNNKTIQVEFETEPSFLTLSVYSRYRNDILLHIAGSANSLNLNVVGMQPYRYRDDKDDLLLTEVHLTDSMGSGNITSNTINLLQRELLGSLEENRVIQDWTIRPSFWQVLNSVPEGMVQEMVSFHGSEDGSYTILEIRLPDSIGLLFRILKVILIHELEILFARIATSADFAYDTFYIRKLNGNGSLNEKEMDDLKARIMMASRDILTDSNSAVSIEF